MMNLNWRQFESEKVHCKGISFKLWNMAEISLRFLQPYILLCFGRFLKIQSSLEKSKNIFWKLIYFPILSSLFWRRWLKLFEKVNVMSKNLTYTFFYFFRIFSPYPEQYSFSRDQVCFNSKKFAETLLSKPAWRQRKNFSKRLSRFFSF